MENSLLDLPETVPGSKPLHVVARAKADVLRRYSVLLRAAGLGIPLMLLSAPILGDLWNLWWNRYGFSHGFLVPLVSLYLVWLQWPALRQIPIEPAFVPGMVWLVVSTVLLLASEIAGVMTTGSLALILLLAGLVWLLCGYAYLRALAFPLAYLIFMTPVLDGLTEPLVWPFQLLTANMSVAILQALGIPVLLEHSTSIILPTVTLEVVRECSGAGLLIAVLAIGLPLASLTLEAWWSRITLVLSSVVIAIVANWVRVAVMGIYAQAGGKDLHGPYHILQGLFVDWVAFGFLFVGAWLLGKVEKVEPAAPLPSLQREEKRRVSGPASHGRALNRAWWMACVTIATATLALYSLDRGTSGLKQELATFPTVIGDWVIDYQPNDESLVVLPDADESIARTYRAPDGRRVNLYVAYTKTQRQGKELVGMGTAPLHEKANATALRVGEGSVPANRTVLEKSRRSIPAVFWYHINGRSYAGRTQAKLATIEQAFLRGRTDGALVLVSAEPRKDQRDDRWKAQEEFAAAIVPLMREYLP
ncbi:MAG TPA: EpsI family protein [Nitrospira sp.]|nr:EpsI family protein [Nitrospira sp.]